MRWLLALIFLASPVWAEYQPQRVAQVVSLRAAYFPLLPQVIPGSPFNTGGGGGSGAAAILVETGSASKISAFSDAGQSVVGDQIPINRSGTNYRLDAQGIFARHFTTVGLPTCNAANGGDFVLDTTVGETKYCDGGSTWVSMARTSGSTSQTFSGFQNIFANSGTGEAAQLSLNNRLSFSTHLEIGSTTVQTPDSAIFYTGTTSNTFHVAEFADVAYDFNNGLSATSAATEPAFIIHGSAQNTTEYNQLNHYGSHGGAVVTLTDNTATAFFHTPNISAGGLYAGTGTYAVKVVDAANEVQTAVGTFEWYGINGNTGGVACGIQNVGNDGVLPGLPLKVASSGTLTVALTTTAATGCTFKMTADTSLTATTFTMTFQANVRTGPAEIVID